MRQAPAALCLVWFVAWGLAVGHAQSSDLPRAHTVVEPRAYVSLEPVPRGRAFEIAVVAKIRPGFHINAHRASQDYLIPTTLEAQPSVGFRVLETIYPNGILRKFKFSPDKLSVYEGEVTLRMKLEAPLDAPLGPHKFTMTLRYQACNEEACLPPVRLPVIAQFTVAAAAHAPARPIHPSIFRTPARTKTPSPR